MNIAADGPTPNITGDEKVDRLIVALCKACAACVWRNPTVFSVAMTMNAVGDLDLFDASVVNSREWLEHHALVSAALEAGIEDGRFDAVGTCLNIADRAIPEDDEIPVMLLRILRGTGAPVHLRVNYRTLRGATIHFREPEFIAPDARTVLN